LGAPGRIWQGRQWDVGALPAICASSCSITVLASSAMGCTTLHRVGCIWVPREMPSKPTTDSCCGTCQALRRSSAIRLIAGKSLEHTSAVGASGPCRYGAMAANSASVWAGISITGRLCRPYSVMASR
jgi:hypothetical protein